MKEGETLQKQRSESGWVTAVQAWLVATGRIIEHVRFNFYSVLLFPGSRVYKVHIVGRGWGQEIRVQVKIGEKRV